MITNMPMTKEEVLVSLEKTAAAMTGQTIEFMRTQPLEAQRRVYEKRHGPLKIISRFPFIGRGNILRDKLVTREEINRQLDLALR